MHDTTIPASNAQRAARLGKASQRHFGHATPWNIVATWRARLRFRRGLEEMWKTAPHLIEDIGLKKWQAEAEIAKPFWQA